MASPPKTSVTTSSTPSWHPESRPLLAWVRGSVAHEVAHQWVYSLVGNNQAENPWLDESLATFGEGIGADSDYRNRDISRRVIGLLGQPMSYWADNDGFDRYTEGVYNQGAAVLLQARGQAGADRSMPHCAPTLRRTRIRSLLRLTSPTPSPRCHQRSTC